MLYYLCIICRWHGVSQRVIATTLLPRAMEYATSSSWAYPQHTTVQGIRHMCSAIFDVCIGFYGHKRITWIPRSLRSARVEPSQGYYSRHLYQNSESVSEDAEKTVSW